MFNILNHPLKIVFIGLVVCSIYLVVDGTIWHYWTLKESEKTLQAQIVNLKKETQALKFNIERAQGASYMERQATESLALVREGDLVFLFSE